ncbi:lactoylglutathione lyase-like lyase [Chthonomonas calidirosea]|uniref:Lactoylglutathione lyase and related lyases n=1 Tax=Chthonomonas calidirosea (strain DSM 23976 / ICMP 18418 / T49) TaxID=1303518 RepID=S0F006_CHTCT|nr:VOC family protein [Chthonomonas calidirosea]CCW36285.1 Lactoylglutathione lyase and related lyases [Chthonomonas calidirosea T49]CEK16717.1 lactoylglutathione lyase-like lyase [Chthonomonas calidirosea]CEK16725.1 lactoylglutathione lyase-like lyase [Chthonomonas calidirosea]CEK17786.1 lactoylglutathione lyase-like lyase [Chthonomonas calidirosea]
MGFTVRELNHVAIHVKDLDTSVDFYERVMGLPRIPRPNFNFPGAWFALGNQELHLIEDKNLTPCTRRHHHFALQVEDTYAVREELEAKGWNHFVSHGPRPDGAIQLFILDPDGYVIELVSPPK